MPLPLLLFALVKVVLLVFVLLTAVAYLVWFERKLIAHMQSRWGPTRVGPFGLLQPLADAIKLLTKEDITPGGAFRVTYLLAPFLSLVVALLAFAVIPFGPIYHMDGREVPLQISDLNIGLLFVLSVSSMGVYGIVLAGWSSNSKYSLLGALRASAQMVSYEVALGLSLVGVLMVSGSFSLRTIVERQLGSPWHWNIFNGGWQFVAFFIYLMAAFAETNRIPFDLPEAETELVAGYHTEYSSMKFAMFFMAEYANMINVGCVATLLFFGGWTSPFGNLIEPPQNIFVHALMPIFWFVAKVFCFLFLYVWVRGTLPRFRYDQLMNFGWRVLMPLSILNIVGTSLWLAYH